MSKQTKDQRKKRLALAWLSVMVLLIAASVFYFTSHNDGMTKEQRVAYRETKEALEMLSKNLNKGVYSVHYINEYDKAKNSIFVKSDSIVQ